MDIFEIADHNKEAERTRAHQLRIAALTVAGVLATLTIALLSARNYFPPAYYTIILALLAAIFLVLLLGLYGNLIIQKVKSYSEKRKHDRLAKLYFEQFKKLVVRFKEFTENREDNIQSAMHYVKNNIPAPNPFSQINVVWPMFIEERYEYYMKRLNQFNGTKDSLVALAKEFESILYMYDTLYIRVPVQEIRIIEGMTIEGNKIPKQYKESYSKARQKYINFIMDYNKFAKDGNEEFKEKEEPGIFGSGKIFRDYFEQPDEL